MIQEGESEAVGWRVILKMCNKRRNWNPKTGILLIRYFMIAVVCSNSILRSDGLRLASITSLKSRNSSCFAGSYQQTDLYTTWYVRFCG
jgi:hypothetical protein